MCCTRNSTARLRAGHRAVIVFLLAGLLGACSDGGGSSGITNQPYTLSGSVGDGPVVNAEIEVTDANGDVVLMTNSDAFANYQIEVPAGTALPITLRARGGIDLVTNRPLDFDLVAASSAVEAQVHLNPQSTLMVATAECAGKGVSARSLDRAWANTQKALAMGLDPARIANPMTAVINADNMPDILLSSEALAEAIRRTTSALQAQGENIEADDVIEELGCDLANDALIDGASITGFQNIGPVYRAAEAAVLVELIAGDLQVDGSSATSLMNNALQTVTTNPSVATVDQVVTNELLTERALDTLLLLQSIESTDITLLQLADVISDSRSSELRTAMRGALTNSAMNALNVLPLEIGQLEQIQQFSQAVLGQSSAKSPFISLSVTDDEVPSGNPTTLSWAATNADRCLAQGGFGWNGPVALSGTYTTDDLNFSADFELACYSPAGANRSKKRVMVTNNQGLELVNQEDVAPTPNPSNSGDNEVEMPRSQPIVAAPAPSVSDEDNDGGGDQTQPDPVQVVITPPSSPVPTPPAPSVTAPPQPNNDEPVTDALYADQLVADCNTYDPATRLCGAGSSVAFSSVLTAMEALTPGDTLYLRGGENSADPASSWTLTPVEEAAIEPAFAGTSDSPTQVSAYPGETVVFDQVDYGQLVVKLEGACRRPASTS